jgi:hypothetical protein
MSNDYAKQKYYEALHSLIGSGPLELRLTYAAIPLVILQARDLPEDTQDDHEALRSALTQEPLSTETGYTPRSVSPEKARELANEVLSIYTRLMGGL